MLYEAIFQPGENNLIPRTILDTPTVNSRPLKQHFGWVGCGAMERKCLLSILLWHKWFTRFFPCNATELVHFRKRIGQAGIELILAESIRVNDDKGGDAHHYTAFIDSTRQEKSVTYPTDSTLHKEMVAKS